MSANTKALVEGWLRKMGVTPKPVADPATLWHFEFDFPVNRQHTMHAVCPVGTPDGVVIASKIDVDKVHLQTFDALDSDAKEEFLWELRKTLNTPRVDFTMEGVAGPMDCPTAIQTSAVRFFDGVTLDSFARTVSCVFKAELAAVWVINRYLAPKGYASGNRFDFKRLGM
jgi:hypothetical protein